MHPKNLLHVNTIISAYSFGFWGDDPEDDMNMRFQYNQIISKSNTNFGHRIVKTAIPLIVANAMTEMVAIKLWETGNYDPNIHNVDTVSKLKIDDIVDNYKECLPQELNVYNLLYTLYLQRVDMETMYNKLKAFKQVIYYTSLVDSPMLSKMYDLALCEVDCVLEILRNNKAPVLIYPPRVIYPMIR